MKKAISSSILFLIVFSTFAVAQVNDGSHPTGMKLTTSPKKVVWELREYAINTAFFYYQPPQETEKVQIALEITEWNENEVTINAIGWYKNYSNTTTTQNLKSAKKLNSFIY